MKKLFSVSGILWILLALLSSCEVKLSDEGKKVPVFQGYIEKTQVNVTTRMPGRITDILVDEGDTVHKGDTVALLDTREIEANRRALVAKLHNVEVNKRRVERLYRAGAIPRQKLDEITTGYEMLQAKLAALDTRIADMTIRAPMDGVITLRVLEKNQMMPPGMPVVVESDLNGTFARFGIPETYLNQLHLGDTMELTTNAGDLKCKGKIIQIIPMANFATRLPTGLRDQRDIQTFDVKLLITEHQKDCKPGMSVFIRLKPVKSSQSSSK